MRTGLAVPLLALAGLLAVAGAAAGDGPGPRHAGDPPVDAALETLADDVDEDGCLRSYDACRPGATKWAAVAAAHAGEDPLTWPTPNASVGTWILDHADDLRDRATQRCDDDASQEPLCMARRVYSLAKSVVAVEALGHDARDLPLPDGGTRDLVADLNENFTTGQYGSPSYVNDDVWALVGLHAAGWDGQKAREAADFVASNQNADGGLGYTPSASSSTDTTAAALAALAHRNRTAFVDDALAFLAEAQVTADEAAGCFALNPGRDANAASTAWALQGLVAAGEDPLDWAANGTAPTDCLLRFQTDGGGFANSLDDAQDRPTVGATMDAVTGLAWTPFGRAHGPVTPETRNRTARADDPVTLHAPAGFLTHGSDAAATVTLTPNETGVHVLDGWTWNGTPRPIEVHLHVRPALPDPPTIDAPDEAPSHEPVPVTLEGDPWTADLHLTLPNGTTLAGADHALHLPPGDHRLVAAARNADGETGPEATHTLRVRNAAPSVTVDGPRYAPPRENVTLHADAQDPGGGPVDIRWEAPDGTRIGSGPNLTLPADPGARRGAVAVATDADGATTRAAHAVRWTGAPPTLTVDGPAEAPAGNVTLAAEAQHPREPVTVTWFLDRRQVAAGPQVTLDLDPGNHTVHVQARTPNATAEATHTVAVHPADGTDERPPTKGSQDAPTDEEASPPPASPAPDAAPARPESEAAAQATPAPAALAALAMAVAAGCGLALPSLREGNR